MMSLEGVFVIDITAFADQLQSAVEARILMLDLMLEASVACLVVVDLAAAANLTAAASVWAVIESVTTTAAVIVVVVTVVLESVTN